MTECISAVNHGDAPVVQAYAGTLSRMTIGTPGAIGRGVRLGSAEAGVLARAMLT